MHNTLVCSLARRERVGLSPAPHFLPCSRPHAYHPFPGRSSLLFTGFWVSPLSFLWKVLGWRVLVLFGLVSCWSFWSIIGRASGLSGAPHPAEGRRGSGVLGEKGPLPGLGLVRLGLVVSERFPKDTSGSAEWRRSRLRPNSSATSASGCVNSSAGPRIRCGRGCERTWPGRRRVSPSPPAARDFRRISILT
jgi:hypothetical protein